MAIEIVLTPSPSVVHVFTQSETPTPQKRRESSSGSVAGLTKNKRLDRKDKSWTSEDDRIRELVAARSARRNSDPTQRYTLGVKGRHSSSSLGPRSRRSSAESSSLIKYSEHLYSFHQEKTLSMDKPSSSAVLRTDTDQHPGALPRADSPLNTLTVISELFPSIKKDS